MKKILLSFFMCMLAIFGMQAETATLSFANKAQRTSYSTDKQVWEQNGITFTNNKSSSTTNVADYANPARLYANSEVVIEFGKKMTEIKFTCSSSEYAAALKKSITVDASVSVSGSDVTATLTAPSTSFTIARLDAQVRLSSLTVTYETAGEGGGEDPEQPGEGGGEEPETPIEPTPDPEEPQGDTKTVNVTFSDYTAGTQYAENEAHVLSEGLTIYTTKCHFTSELRIYSSGTNNGYVVSNKLPGAITNMTFNAGNKVDDLNVYGSTNGSDWTLVGAVKVTSTSYNDYSLDFKGDYTYFKLDVAGTQQIRLKKMSVTYKFDESIVLPPTFSPEGGIKFVESMDVEINHSEAFDIYYSFTENGDYQIYTQPITITETTTVYAYAKNGEKRSDIVSATYTRKEVVEGVWEKITDATTIIEGAEVVIVAAESDFALSTTQKTNNRDQGEVIKKDDNVYFGNDVQILTIEQGVVDNTWAFNAGGGYLYAAGSGDDKQLKTTATKEDANGSWAITIVDGVASVIAQGANTNNDLKYNTSGLFSCYGENNTQKNVSLYRKYVEANITAGMYYLVPGEWEDEDLALYGVKFVNVNTGENEWVQGFLNNHYVYFQLDGEGKYTHMAFYRIANTGNTTTTVIKDDEWDAIEVLDKTPELTYTAPANGKIMRYIVDESKWEEVEIGSGLNRVELAGGIGYAYGVVSAEGAIEVYNVNGAVVARGNDTIDLRGLGRGVYIIRNGNQVRKVVR